MTDLGALGTPVFRRGLGAARHLLELTGDHARSTGLAEEEVLGWRLVPDMFDFGRQFVVLADGARGTAALLAGRMPDPADDPPYAVFNRGAQHTFHDPRSLAGLDAYVAESARYLDSLPKAAFAGPPDRPIRWTMSGAWRQTDALSFLQAFALPNFWFHLSMAYANMRLRGVAVGKEDYEGPPVYEKGIGG